MMHDFDFSKFSRKALDTFNNIVTCAKEEFSSKAYANTTISSIANRAHISVGCIYKYFENKDELYKYILDNEQTNIRSALNAAIKSAPNREERERAGLKAWLLYVKENPGIYKLIWESLFSDLDAFIYYYKTFTDSYARALDKDSDQIAAEDTNTIAFMLIGISNFLGIKLMIEGDFSDKKIDSIVDTAMVILKQGLIKK